MTTPTAGPFVKNKGFANGTYKLIDLTNWYTQRRPYSLQLNFLREFGQVRKVKGSTPAQISSTWESIVSSFSSPPQSSFPNHLNAYNLSYETAYNRFVNQMKRPTHASMGVTVAEYRESAALIHTRSVTLLDSIYYLRKRDPVGFFKTLFGDVKPSRSDKRKFRTAKRLSDLYLEYSFGWSPLVQDIGNASSLLASPPRSDRIRSRSGKVDCLDTNTFGFCVSQYQCSIRGEVYTSNLFLRNLNELGFINPAQVAWDLIPFSFLVNWFVPVSQFLGSYTDFVGVTVKNCSVTRHVQVLNSSSSVSYPFTASFQGYAIYRYAVATPSVPGLSSLRLRIPGGDLMGKAASSVALLVQQLTHLR